MRRVWEFWVKIIRNTQEKMLKLTLKLLCFVSKILKNFNPSIVCWLSRIYLNILIYNNIEYNMIKRYGLLRMC